MKNCTLAETASVTAAMALLCFAQTAIAVEPAALALGNYGDLFLQTGNANDAYWVENNSWGAGSITQGTAPDQFEQQVGVSPTVGSNGEVAFRMKWRWPNPVGAGEVKGYPSILSGAKPGYAGGKQIMLPDGSRSGALGVTPGSIFPLQLPIKSLKGKFSVKNTAAPTGQGHLSYDIWLQSAPGQDNSWGNSSITHEIMIPLQNWGDYGAHNVPGGRNPGWYDHDAVIGGKLYHVYATKGADGALLYNFGQLNGTYGKTGWKMIAFVPDVLPVPAGEIDLAAIINYLATRKDVMGNPWALGNEYLVSAELGVEPVSGTGDITVYDYKVSTTSSAPTPAPAPTPTPTPSSTPTPTPTPAPAPSCGSSSWTQGKQYAVGSVVSYPNGKLYIAKVANPGYDPIISTYYWSQYVCSVAAPAPVPAPGPAPAPKPACGSSSWTQGKQYAVGSVVSYPNGKLYIAKVANPGYDPIISTYYWSQYVCSVAAPAPAAVPAPAPAPACGNSAWIQGKQYAVGSVVSLGGKLYIAKVANPGYNPTISTYYWSLYAC